VTSPYNPYQAPAFEAAEVTLPGDFSIGQCIRDAFDRTKRYFGSSLGVLLLGSLLMLLAAITIIGYFIIVPVLAWGMVKFYLDLQDDQPNLHNLFAGFSSYGKVLGRTLLFVLIWILTTLASESLVFVGQAMHSTPVIVFGYLVYLVLFVLVLSRFYFALFFLVDRDMTVVEALSAAWQVTRGKSLKLFALMMVSALVAMSGAIGLLIGLLFTVPMSYAMYTSAYRQLSPR
jgi:hypothetical protein